MAGIPLMLATLIGWPLPAHLPSWDELMVVLTSPPTERLVMNSLAIAAWAIWAAFVYSLTGEVVALARHGLAERRAQPVGRNPARHLAMVLFTALATGTFAHTTNAATTVEFDRPAAVAMVTARPYRRHGTLVDIAGMVITSAADAGLRLVDRCPALIAAVRDGRLVPRASFFQLRNVRSALAQGDPQWLPQHETVLVFQALKT